MLTEGAFEVLRAAVKMAADAQIKKRAELEARLKHTFPGREADVCAALDKWVEYIEKHGNSA